MKANVVILTLCGAMMIVAGCRKTNMVDKMAFKSAINNYWSARNECVWPDPIKFPAQADTSKENQTKGYDALTDAGVSAWNIVQISGENNRRKSRFHHLRSRHETCIRF